MRKTCFNYFTNVVRKIISNNIKIPVYQTSNQKQKVDTIFRIVFHVSNNKNYRKVRVGTLSIKKRVLLLKYQISSKIFRINTLYFLAEKLDKVAMFVQ